jgi:hypothetical protein
MEEMEGRRVETFKREGMSDVVIFYLSLYV